LGIYQHIDSQAVNWYYLNRTHRLMFQHLCLDLNTVIHQDTMKHSHLSLYQTPLCHTQNIKLLRRMNPNLQKCICS